MNIFEACKTGDLDWLRQQKAAGTLPKLMERNAQRFFPHDYAAHTGRLEVLKWLVLESGQHVDITADHDSAARFAAAYGHLETLQWLVLEWPLSEAFGSIGRPVDVTAENNQAVVSAAEDGYLDVVKWLVFEWPKTPAFKHHGRCVDVTDNDNEAMRRAIENVQFDVVRWLVEQSEQPVEILTPNDFPILMAARRGYGEIFGYLDVVAQFGLENFRTAMRALNGNLTVTSSLAPLITDGLTLTEADFRVLAATSGQKTRTTSLRQL